MHLGVRTPDTMRLASVSVMPAPPATNGRARSTPSHFAAASKSLSGGACRMLVTPGTETLEHPPALQMH